MSDCIFCRILAGELPASFVYRDERCAAFMELDATAQRLSTLLDTESVRRS